MASQCNARSQLPRLWSGNIHGEAAPRCLASGDGIATRLSIQRGMSCPVNEPPTDRTDATDTSAFCNVCVQNIQRDETTGANWDKLLVML